MGTDVLEVRESREGVDREARSAHADADEGGADNRSRILILAERPFVLRALAGALDACSEEFDVADHLITPGPMHLPIGSASPEVVVVDCPSPVTKHASQLRAIAGAFPDASIVAVLDDFTHYDVGVAWASGAHSIALRDTPPASLAEVVGATARGEARFCALSTRRLIAAYCRRAEQQPKEIDQLSSRERHVVDELCLGASNAEIARRLEISESTVKSHLAAIMVKWGARGRVDVVLTAIRAGLIELT